MNLTKTRPEDLPTGPRRLTSQVNTTARLFANEDEARKELAKLVRKYFETSLDTFEDSYAKISFSGGRVHLRIHPACGHVARMADLLGGTWEIADRLNWNHGALRAQSETRMESFARIPTKPRHGGRIYP